MTCTRCHAPLFRKLFCAVLYVFCDLVSLSYGFRYFDCIVELPVLCCVGLRCVFYVPLIYKLQFRLVTIFVVF